ncbi:MAG: GNAT family N-acetyltransferase [Deltaproteobacteria bacterium]|nr:GNAT family N-acetyltransferase [Deltaproteobacteria bacterium]
MNWQLTPTEDLKTVLNLYHQIFPDSLLAEDFSLRTSGYNTHMYLVRVPDEAPIGFAIYRGRGSEVELWQAGVIPEKRRQKAGSTLLEQGENKMIEKGYSRLTVNTFNHWNIMLSMLFQRGYRIINTVYSNRRDDVKIKLYRKLRPHRELRYALTEKCNFKCLFCHNEGLGHEKRKQLSDEQVLEVLMEAIRLGHTDITFTGGEPLLNKKRLHFLLDQFSSLEHPPDVTLVTNASLLDGETVTSLAQYPGKRKIHLSLHATDESSFKKITGVSKDGVFDKVVANVRLASQSGLTVKVNHVVLRELNHERVVNAVELARSLGAATIKFIELLVLPDNPGDYRMYYDINAIQKEIEKIADGPYPKSPRQNIYNHKEDSSFSIELQRCTCALGCSHCREIRDRTISSDLSYHPCFVRHKRHYPIREPQRLEQLLTNGDRIIDGYANRYQDLSPTLIQKEKYVTGKREVFFRIDSPENFRKFLKGKKFSQKAASGFHEEYFRPVSCSEAWKKYERVLKIGWDYHNRSKVHLIYTDHRYTRHPVLGLESTTRFLESSGPMQFESAERARHFLGRLDFEKFMELEWEIETWAKNSLELNLSLSGEHSTLKLCEPSEKADPVMQLLKDYKGRVEPLTEPLVQFMQRIQK